MYQVEVVWNREFDYVPYGPVHEDKQSARKFAREAKEMGDGMRVKKAQIIHIPSGEVEIPSYKI